jgi:hypothetical protein
MTSAQILAELSTRMDVQTQTLRDLIAVIAQTVNVTPAPVPAPAKKAAPKVAAAPVNAVKFSSHVVELEYAHTQAATGWHMRKVTSVDGTPLKDHYTDARRTEINATLPCSVQGCPEHRVGNNALCKDHKAAKRPAQLAWKAAGTPAYGTDAWKAYMGMK